MTRFTSMLLRIASGICTADDRAAILEPLVADWQREYAEAHRQSRMRAASVVIRGTLALALTMLICANPFRGVDGVPARRFAATALAFATASAFIQLAPVQAITQAVSASRFDQFLYFPRLFALGLAIAILPAAMLTAGRLPRSRLIVLMAMALAIAFVASDLIAPRSERLQKEYRVRSTYAAEDADWILAQEAKHRSDARRDAPEKWARAEALERHRDGAFVALTVSLGLLGAAIGRAYRGTPPRLAVAGLWWFSSWMALGLLQFGSNRLRVAIQMPIEATTWIPTLVILTVAVVAELKFRATCLGRE